MSALRSIVVGGGPAGLAAACLLGQAGVPCVLVATTFRDDPRTVALMQPALGLLEDIGLWPGELRAHSAPLRRQRLIGDTGALFESPELMFDARELGLEAFGWNIPLQQLILALRARAEELGVVLINSRVRDAQTTDDHITSVLEDGRSIRAEFCLAADGAASLLRARAGIQCSQWAYKQTALVSTFDHSAPHNDTSSEYHKEAGPCTTVPLPGRRSALVWLERPQRAEKLAALPAVDFASEVQVAIHGELGLVSAPSPVTLFPMRGLSAQRFAKGRTLLIGEAAHVVPPIGAQGLNMSLRDARLAALLVSEARSDEDSKTLINRFDRERSAEVGPRSAIIHSMNKSLLLGLPPLEWARSASLWALNGFPPLRREAMRYGLGQTMANNLSPSALWPREPRQADPGLPFRP